MCKLFAYVNHETTVIPAYMETKINKALRHLFYINSFGQVDGSGLMWMDKQGNTDFIKEALPSPTFMELKCFDRVKNSMASKKFVAGHTRYSTVGSNNWENSHPFEFGNFLGIQNGTISNAHKTLVKGITSPCDVDSASVFWAFNQQGVKTTLENYEGEGVFMFMDKERKSFNVVKNEYRTLYCGKIDKYDAYILSTDKCSLELVAGRSGLTFEEVYPIVDDKLIEFTQDNKVEISDMEVPGPVIQYGGYYNSGGNYSFKSNRNIGGNRRYNTPVTVTGNANKVTATPNKSTTTKKSKAANAAHDNYYVMDCDICLDPIYTNSAAYCTDPDPLKANNVSCRHCQDFLEEFSGKPVYKINNLEELIK